MTVADDAPRPAAGPGFADAVSFAFGDAAADCYGLARIGLSTGADGLPQASGLAVLFAGQDPVAVRAAGGIGVADRAWEAVDAAGVRTTVAEPLRAWTLAFEAEDGAAGFELRFEACSEPALLDDDDPVATTGGMQGYDQLCRVTGTARVRGGVRRVDCLGQRGHSWGKPDWDKLVLTRTVGAWLSEDLGVSLGAVRGKKAKSHTDEALAAVLFAPSPGDDGAAALPALARSIAEPRLSTTMDADGRQRRAGLELYENDDEDAFARRAAGEVLCGTSLDLGRLRLDCAFFRWHMEGRTGVGRYDVLRRA